MDSTSDFSYLYNKHTCFDLKETLSLQFSKNYVHTHTKIVIKHYRNLVWFIRDSLDLPCLFQLEIYFNKFRIQ